MPSELAPTAAIRALREHQRQLDVDGVEVGVSRQALDETLAWIAALNSPKLEVTELLEAAKAFARQFPTNPTGAAISVDFTRLSKAARAFALAALAKPDQGEQM